MATRPRTVPRRTVDRRAEQLRAAKRAQRKRERERGLVSVQFVLPEPLAARLAVARRDPDFEQALARFLDVEVVDVARYPQLALLCWNRSGTLVTAREAHALYEGNRRFIDATRMDAGERALFDSLNARHGTAPIRGQHA